jgi:Uma2 family endonuclease
MTTHASSKELLLVRKYDGLEIELNRLQGSWSENQYFRLTNISNHLLEFIDGELEVLAMPTRSHQRIAKFLFIVLMRLVQQLGGEVLFAPLRLQIRQGKFREPDILLLLDRNDPRSKDGYWLGADLVVEVVSPDDPERDTVTKVVDYAEARIPEYWIVNPIDETVTVLTLEGAAYREHGRFARGDTATSPLLPALTADVSAVFDAAV